MRLDFEQSAFPGGAARADHAIDLRSRRLKAVITDENWQTGKLRLRVPGNPPDDLIQQIVTTDEAGNEKTVTAAAASTCYMMDARDMEGVDWLLITSDVDQGTPAGFAVIPNTTDFSVPPAVTFTVHVHDGVDGDAPEAPVVLNADYTDVDGLVAELQSQAPTVNWTNNAGAVTAEYSGGFNSYVDVTDIVDGSDKMNFSSIIGFAFPGYASDAYVTLITEPRT